MSESSFRRACGRSNATTAGLSTSADVDPILQAVVEKLQACLADDPEERPTIRDLTKVFDTVATQLGDRRLHQLPLPSAAPEDGTANPPDNVAPTELRSDQHPTIHRIRQPAPPPFDSSEGDPAGVPREPSATPPPPPPQQPSPTSVPVVAKSTRSRRLTPHDGMLIAGLAAGLAAIVIGAVIMVSRGGGDSSTATSTSPPTVTTNARLSSTEPAFVLTGDTPCRAADGTSPRTITFAKAPPSCIDAAKTYTAEVTTNKGAYTIALDPGAAPLTVNNLVVLARYHYFDNTICHRAIPGFVVQCGDPTGTGSGGPGYTLADELPAAGPYKVRSVAMANSGPDTNGTQFFIITGDNGVALSPDYTLFGQVTDGLDTTVRSLDALGNSDPAANGVPPLEPIIVQSIIVTES